MENRHISHFFIFQKHKERMGNGIGIGEFQTREPETWTPPRTPTRTFDDILQATALSPRLTGCESLLNFRPLLPKIKISPDCSSKKNLIRFSSFQIHELVMVHKEKNFCLFFCCCLGFWLTGGGVGILKF